jgi:hypothetical protein
MLWFESWLPYLLILFSFRVFGCAEIRPTYPRVTDPLSQWSPSRNAKSRLLARKGAKCLSGPFLARQMSSVGVGLGAVSGRRKSEEPPLLLPIVRQISGKGYETCRRQLSGLFTGHNCAIDFGGEIRETHEHCQIIAPDTEPRRHGIDAVITARKEHGACSNCSGDQGNKAVVDRFYRAIADYQSQVLPPPAKACGDRQDQRLDRRHTIRWLGSAIGHDARHDRGSIKPHQDLSVVDPNLLDEGSHELAKLEGCQRGPALREFC